MNWSECLRLFWGFTNKCRLSWATHLRVKMHVSCVISIRRCYIHTYTTQYFRSIRYCIHCQMLKPFRSMYIYDKFLELFLKSFEELFFLVTTLTFWWSQEYLFLPEMPTKFAANIQCFCFLQHSRRSENIFGFLFACSFFLLCCLLLLLLHLWPSLNSNRGNPPVPFTSSILEDLHLSVFSIIISPFIALLYNHVSDLWFLLLQLCSQEALSQ